MSSTRRLRLGTKSCAECRRRKIRCVFPPSSSTCESCAIHKVRCRAQQPRDDSPGEISDNEDLKKRMAQLEGLVSQLQGALAVQGSSPSSKASPYSVISHTGLENGLATPRSPSVSLSVSGSGQGSEYQEHGFENASLVSLFSSTHIGQKIIDTSRLGAEQSRRVQELKTSLAKMLPDQFVIKIVVDDTAKYFGCWPGCSYDAENSLPLKPGQFQEAYEFVIRSLQSDRAAHIAKGVVFLCCCLQQLPTRSKARQYLPANLGNLAEEYIDIASSLLYQSASQSDTFDGLEARMLLFKLCIDLGKPRMAWTTARSAVEVALLMGCHSPDASEKKMQVWKQVWKMDRQPSLMLGLPCAIHNVHPAVQNSQPGISPLEKINDKLARLFGNISDRDQTRRDDDYVSTVQLDQDAMEIGSLFPDEWAHEATFNTMALEQVYYIQTTILRYHSALRQVHLPFMLRSTSEARYQHSRVCALHASRQVVKAYLFMKKHKKTREIYCDLMDIEALSCCVTIIVGLLSESSASRNMERESEDLALLDECASDLRGTAELLGCPVATQASQVMEYLLGAMRQDPDIPDHFETAIPFFGQMRINKNAVIRRDATASAVDTTSVNSSSVDSVMPDVIPPYSNVIEFMADPYHHTAPCEYTSGGELALNWQDAMNWDTTFDWGQTFTEIDFGHFRIDEYDSARK